MPKTVGVPTQPRLSALHNEIMSRLDLVKDPCSVASGRPLGLVEMGLIKEIEVDEHGAVDVHLRLTSPACYLMTFLESESTDQVSQCEGVSEVRIHPDEGLDWSPSLISVDQLSRGIVK
jgi:metal-sulfur cluster biosynthetic enzyme